jgi:hypothetical protein
MREEMSIAICSDIYGVLPHVADKMGVSLAAMPQG